MKLHFFAILFAAAHLVSCSSTLRDDEKAKGFELGTLPKSRWQSAATGKEGFHFFQNPSSGSMIGVDSVCKRYQESSLETLSKSLTRPIDNTVVTEQKKIELDGREALETRAMGTVDGVDVEALFMIFRKNNCLFDFSLISRNRVKTEDENDFRKFVESFRFEGSVP